MSARSSARNAQTQNGRPASTRAHEAHVTGADVLARGGVPGAVLASVVRLGRSQSAKKKLQLESTSQSARSPHFPQSAIEVSPQLMQVSPHLHEDSPWQP